MRDILVWVRYLRKPLLELPVPVVLVVLWLFGALLLGLVVGVLVMVAIALV